MLGKIHNHPRTIRDREGIVMSGKTHNYTRCKPTIHYVIEAAKEDLSGRRFHMTSTGKGIKTQDYILLKDDLGDCKYQVEEIHYYCDTPDYWTALLVKCP